MIVKETPSAPQQRATATVSRPADEKRAPFSAAVIAVYLCLGLIAFWPSLGSIGHRLFSDITDYTLSIWFLGWAPHALVHGLNPFFSNAMFAPAGVNLAENTEGPLLGWVLAPITLIWGPMIAANVLLVLAMPISAAAAFIVLQKWRVWNPAAALGGLVYGFSPYMVGQALGHPVLLFVPLPPFILSTLVLILLRRGPDRRLGMQLGLLLSAQYLISPEVFASLCLIVGIGLVLVVLRNPPRAFHVAQVVMQPIGIALAVTVLLLAYPVGMLLAGPQHVASGTSSLFTDFHNDLLTFVSAGPNQRVSLGPHLSSGTVFGVKVSNPTEAGGYVGIPVLIVTSVLVWRSRRSARMQLSVALFVSSAILSLGPFLYVDGKRTHVPLPFWIVSHLPLVDNLIPMRVSFEMSACLAAIVAFGLDDLRKAPSRLRNTRGAPRRTARSHTVGAVVVTGVVLAALVVTQLPRWPYESTEAVTLPTSLSRTIPSGDPMAITYPYASGPIEVLPLLWQAAAGYRFRLLGGYALHPDQNGNATLNPNPLSPNGLQAFLSNKEIWLPLLPVTPNLVATARTTVSRYHVRMILVDRSYPGGKDVVDLFGRAFGASTETAGVFTLWILPARKSRA